MMMTNTSFRNSLDRSSNSFTNNTSQRSLQEEYDDGHPISRTSTASSQGVVGDDSRPAAAATNSTAEVEFLRQQLAERDLQMNELQQELATTKRRNDTLEKRLQVLLGNTSGNNNNSSKEADSANSKLNRLNQHLEQMQQQQDVQMQKTVNLSVALAESKARVNELESDLEEYKNLVHNTHNNNSAATPTNTRKLPGRKDNFSGGSSSAAGLLANLKNSWGGGAGAVTTTDSDQSPTSVLDDPLNHSPTSTNSTKNKLKNKLSDFAPITEIQLDDDDNNNEQDDDEKDLLEELSVDLDSLNWSSGAILTHASERGTKSSTGTNVDSRWRRRFP